MQRLQQVKANFRQKKKVLSVFVLASLFILLAPDSLLSTFFEASSSPGTVEAAANQDLHKHNKQSSWMDGCRLLYLDVGTNRGVQIRKLFEPHLYPKAPVLEVYDEIFGTNRSSMKDLCAVGWEPNIHHAPFLKVCSLEIWS
jgi:hypothetical protein